MINKFVAEIGKKYYVRTPTKIFYGVLLSADNIYGLTLETEKYGKVIVPMNSTMSISETLLTSEDYRDAYLNGN